MDLLDAEAEKLTQVALYERNEQSQSYRSGHYNCNLATTFGDVPLKATKKSKGFLSKWPS